MTSEARIPPRRGYNVDEVGETRQDSLGILNLIGNTNEREVKINYKKLQVHIIQINIIQL